MTRENSSSEISFMSTISFWKKTWTSPTVTSYLIVLTSISRVMSSNFAYFEPYRVKLTALNTSRSSRILSFVSTISSGSPAPEGDTTGMSSLRSKGTPPPPPPRSGEAGSCSAPPSSSPSPSCM